MTTIEVRSREPVEAAMRLWHRSSELAAGERALCALQGCFAGFDPSSTLLKVAALSSFDSSRAFPIATTFAHFQSVLMRTDLRCAGPEFVDALAELPRVKRDSPLAGWTLASRFAHAFVDADRFPVLDGWSERALSFELQRTSEAADLSRYARFYIDHARLAASFAPARPSAVGTWLWLAGQFRAWSRNRRTPIHRAVRELFESGASELSALASNTERVAERAEILQAEIR